MHFLKSATEVRTRWSLGIFRCSKNRVVSIRFGGAEISTSQRIEMDANNSSEAFSVWLISIMLMCPNFGGAIELRIMRRNHHLNYAISGLSHTQRTQFDNLRVGKFSHHDESKCRRNVDHLLIFLRPIFASARLLILRIFFPFCVACQNVWNPDGSLGWGDKLTERIAQRIHFKVDTEEAVGGAPAN